MLQAIAKPKTASQLFVDLMARCGLVMWADGGEAAVEDDTVEGGEADEGEGGEGGMPEGDDTIEGGEGTDTEGEGGLTVTIGDEEPEQSEEEKAIETAPQWVKDLRKKQRETEKENRELKKKLAAPAAQTETVDAVGTKPTLEGCDYDADKFEADLIAWQERKRKADDLAAKKAAEAEEAEKAFKAKLEAYGTSKTELAAKAKDFKDMEDSVTEVLSPSQQGMVIDLAKNPALVIYALGKNPKKTKELAALTNYAKFAYELAVLESNLKVTPMKKPPLPEKPIRGGAAPIGGGSDTTLQRLREAAEKSGDYTEVNKYKKQQKAKQQQK